MLRGHKFGWRGSLAACDCFIVSGLSGSNMPLAAQRGFGGHYNTILRWFQRNSHFGCSPKPISPTSVAGGVDFG